MCAWRVLGACSHPRPRGWNAALGDEGWEHSIGAHEREMDRRNNGGGMPEPRLIGKYEIVEELGRGGFAVVYKARDVRLERDVALKVIHGNFAQEQAFVDRFKAEVQTSARLRHPNIVAVYDFDDLNGVLYLAMELIAGRSLRALAKAS